MKALHVIQVIAVLVQVDLQPLVQQVPGRVREETAKVRQGNGPERIFGFGKLSTDEARCFPLFGCQASGGCEVSLGIGEKSRTIFEIGRVERLQRMPCEEPVSGGRRAFRSASAGTRREFHTGFHGRTLDIHGYEAWNTVLGGVSVIGSYGGNGVGQALFRRIIGRVRVTGTWSISPIDDVHQLTHQNRGRDDAVVPTVLTRVADVEPVAGGKQSFEEKIAVFVSNRSVPGPRVLCHEVEFGGLGLPGERVFIHADEANHLERNTAHRQHRAECDPSRHEPEAKASLLQVLAEVPSDQFKVHRVPEFRDFPDFPQVRDSLPESLHLELRVFIQGEKTGDRRRKEIGPLAEEPG